MSTVIETRVGSLVTLMAAALQVELEDAHNNSGIPKPEMITALPGSLVAFDYCDTGGMAWARLGSIAAVQTLQGSNCLTEYDVVVEVAILRCAPTLDEEGNLPSSEEQFAAFMQQMFDMGILHKVLTCTKIPASFTSLTLGEYVPVGPDGGCIGGLWTATARFA